MSHILIVQTTAVLTQLADAVNQLDKAEYKRPLETLSGSSIGQHVRHVIEFYQCMMNGYDQSILNYDARKRELLIEENLEFALECMHKILADLAAVNLSRKMTLEVTYEQTIQLSTSLERELVYNIEHAIHHMALIKIGIKEINTSIQLPAEFGVAASTLRHHQDVHRNVFAKN